MSRVPLKNSRLLRTSALATSALLLIAGCAGTPSADTSSAASGSSAESATPTPTPTATPTPTPSYKPASAEGPAENVPVPVMPAAAKEHTEEGYKAFVEYWVALVNHAHQTRTTDVIAPFTSSKCGSCQNILGSSEYMMTQGKWMVGGDWTVVGSYTDMTKNSGGQIQGLVEMRQDRVDMYSGPSKRENTEKASTIKLIVILQPSEKGWIVVDIGTPEGASK